MSSKMNERGYRIGLYEKAMPAALSWRQRAAAAREAGFDYIEMSIDESEERLERLDWDEQKILSIAAEVRSEGLLLGSICLSAHRKYPLGGEDPERSLEIMQKAIGLASTAGIPIIQLAGYDSYYAESTAQTRSRFQENLSTAVLMAAREGILLAFETMETPFMDTVGKAMGYVTEMGSPYLGVYPDIGNLNNAALLYGNSVIDDLASGEGHLFAIHIKETVPGKYREVPFGTGVVDFPGLLQTCWTLGVRRYVTELWYTGNDDWEGSIAEAASLATAILDPLAAAEIRG